MSNVNHPKHYNEHPSGIECIEIIRHENFNCGSAIKYVWRRAKKDPAKEIEDLEKAIWYLQDEITRLKNMQSLQKTKIIKSVSRKARTKKRISS